ncbi:MAG: hypothetical protein ACC655_07605 [Rhodothermia bacterium]
MNHIATRAAFAVMLAAIVVSCELVDPETGDRNVSMNVTFDLRSSTTIGEDGIPECRSVAREVVLTVPDSTYRDTVDALNEPVTFDSITVNTGSVRFSADVMSNSERAKRLFSGSTTRDISGNKFEDVFIMLEKIDDVPVMEACATGDDLSIQIRNRGLGTLSWTINPLETKDCLDEADLDVACVSFMPQSGQLEAGATEGVMVTVLAPQVTQTFETRINSAQGYIDFSVTPQQNAGLNVRLVPVN